MTPDKIWTTRKLGLSARFSPTDKSTNWLLFYPESTSGFSRRLEEVFKSDAKRKAPRRHDLEVHLLLMRTANQNWTPHLNDLDKEFRVMDARVFLWRPQKQKSIANAHQGPGLEMEDTQRIQMFKVKLLHVSHSLEINCANIASLRRALELFKIEGENQYANECQYQKYDRALKELHFQTTQHIIRVKNLIRCTDGLFALVCTIVSCLDDINNAPVLTALDPIRIRTTREQSHAETLGKSSPIRQVHESHNSSLHGLPPTIPHSRMCCLLYQS